MNQAIGLEIIFAKSTPDEVLNAIFAGNARKEIREAVSMIQVPNQVISEVTIRCAINLKEKYKKYGLGFVLSPL